MAAPPRPPPGLPNKRSTMRPPNTRPPIVRGHSAFTSSSQTRTRSGAASPAESQLSTISSMSQRGSPAKAASGTKRKERDFETEGAEETNIHVVVRCRGRSDREVRENSGVVVSTDGVKGQNVELSMGPSALSNKTYRFDKVFSPAADQSMIYDEVVTPILDEMLAGYNCTIFAYGQTGTGKTYTMSGDMSDTLGLISDSAGIIPRVLNSLFRKLDADEGESSVKCSFIELYNEELRDLLSPDDSVKLKIYEDAQKKGHTATLVQGMEESHIKSATDGIRILQNGSHKRQVAATKCNDLSSRSHTVFTVTAYIKRATDAGEDFVSAGKLNLVDLAGSENIQRSGAENKRAAEAGLINKSLLTLGRVINALVERGSHIPYRESKLTRLLQDSLGGRTKTCIIATVSPAKSNLEETISTLDYAFRAKNIKNKPQVNSMISKKTLLKEFTAEIEKLKSELIATRHRNGVYLTAEGYDEIMEQSESRRILSEEQRERIETMEVSLRNKVQDLFHLNNSFTILKKDFETTRQILEDTKGVLAKTESVLTDTRQSLADETVIRKAHQSTEAGLLQTGGELQSVLGQVTNDIETLHSKIQRKTQLDETNREGWHVSQDKVVRVTGLLQERMNEFQHQQTQLSVQLSSRMQSFVSDQLSKIETNQELLNTKTSCIEDSEKEVVQQSIRAKDEMNVVLEEIKTLREEVKREVGEGLEGLSTAAGRISAEVINELGAFHTQLNTSYSSLGKDFKIIFDDLKEHLQTQRAEVEEARQRFSKSAKDTIESERLLSSKMESVLQEERENSTRERKKLITQITDLVNRSGEEQEQRWNARVEDMKQDLAESQKTLSSADQTHTQEMEDLSKKSDTYIEQVTQSREGLKIKMKEDWNSISGQNNSIQTTTRSVHEETIRIVDAQMADMARQMQTLDNFVTRARSQNERHHESHVGSIHGLAKNVDDTYSHIGSHLASTSDCVHAVGSEVSSSTDAIQASLLPFSAFTQQSLTEIQGYISNTSLQEYISTGQTPQRMQYQYPTTLPRTQDHDKLLGRTEKAPKSPSKSPSKTIVYTDAPTTDAPPTISLSPSKDMGLREISLNVSTALQRNNSDPAGLSLKTSTIGGKPDGDTGMGPPPLKRQATESKLPTKLGGGGGGGTGKGGGVGGMVKLEGREKENLSASFGSLGRRLRTSPIE